MTGRCRCGHFGELHFSLDGKSDVCSACLEREIRADERKRIRRAVRRLAKRMGYPASLDQPIFDILDRRDERARKEAGS